MLRTRGAIRNRIPSCETLSAFPLQRDIDDYYEREVKPHVPDSWIDKKKNKVGYEINFNRYFYQYTPLRSLKEITDELLALERKSEGLLNEVLGL